MTARIQSKISPSLWLDGKAIEAAEFYTSLFRNSRMIRATKFTTGPAEGSGLAEFELEGQTFTAFDGIPPYEFTPALSLVIACDSQEEIDHFWDGLSDGGAPIQSGMDPGQIRRSLAGDTGRSARPAEQSAHRRHGRDAHHEQVRNGQAQAASVA